MKTKCTRGIIYFIGLIVLALGIVLNTKTLLGVSPIISIPYNICHIWHLNLGAITFVFYCFCVLIEAILKGKEFKLYELLQIPMSLVTSVFINIFDQYLNIVPDTLEQKLLVLFFAIVVTGIGAATMHLQRQSEINLAKAWGLAKMFLMLLVFVRQESLDLYLQDIS